MTTLTNVDLRFNLIGSIPSNVCTLLDNTENIIAMCYARYLYKGLHTDNKHINVYIESYM